jgi:hypothetical protein
MIALPDASSASTFNGTLPLEAHVLGNVPLLTISDFTTPLSTKFTVVVVFAVTVTGVVCVEST